MVADEGMGLADDEIVKSFEPYRPTDAVRNTIPDVSLGHSVSRRIIEAHGGKINVHSRLGVGTTFTVRLPVDRSLPHASGCRQGIAALRRRKSARLGQVDQPSPLTSGAGFGVMIKIIIVASRPI